MMMAMLCYAMMSTLTTTHPHDAGMYCMTGCWCCHLSYSTLHYMHDIIWSAIAMHRTDNALVSSNLIANVVEDDNKQIVRLDDPVKQTKSVDVLAIGINPYLSLSFPFKKASKRIGTL